MNNSLKRGKKRHPVSYFSAYIFIARACECQKIFNVHPFLHPRETFFQKGQFQLNQNSNACVSWPDHLLLHAVCSDTYHRIPSLTACFFEGINDVDRSHKSSCFYVSSLKTALYVLGLLQFNVRVC